MPHIVSSSYTYNLLKYLKITLKSSPNCKISSFFMFFFLILISCFNWMRLYNSHTTKFNLNLRQLTCFGMCTGLLSTHAQTTFLSRSAKAAELLWFSWFSITFGFRACASRVCISCLFWVSRFKNCGTFYQQTTVSIISVYCVYYFVLNYGLKFYWFTAI